MADVQYPPTTFTIPTTAVYRTPDGKESIRWEAGTVIGYATAVRFGLAPNIPTPSASEWYYIQQGQTGDDTRITAVEAEVATVADTVGTVASTVEAVETAVARLDPGVMGDPFQYVSVIDGAPTNVSPSTINATWFGLVSDGIADDTAALQAVLDAGAGKSVTIPRGSYKLSSPLIPSDNTEITIQPGCTFTQTVKYTPIFDVNQINDVVIRCNNALMQWIGSRTYTGGTGFRGGDTYLYGAAIWSSGNRNRYYDVRAKGLTCGVFFSAWNGSIADTDYVHEQNELHGLLVEDVDFGVLMSGESAPILRNIRGHFSLQTSSPNPAHLIYISDIARQRDVDLDGAVALAGTEGHAYSLRGIDGGKCINLYARDCPGIASLSASNDVTVSLRSRNDVGDAPGNGSLYMFSSPNRCTIDLDIHVADTATGFRLARVDGNDNVVRLHGRQRQTTTVANHDVTVQGLRNRIDYDVVNIANDGSDLSTGRRGVGLLAGSDHQVFIHQARNTINAGEVTSGVTGCSFTLNSKRITTASGTVPTNTLLLNEVNTTVNRDGVQRWTINGAGLTVRSDRTLYRIVHVNVTTADAFTIQTPYGAAQPGTDLTIVVSNTSGGSMGTITWTGFTLGTAWTNPASAAEKSITFVWDGVRWKDIGRTA